MMRLFDDYRQVLIDGHHGFPILVYGIRLRMVPALAELQFEVQRAPNVAGSPGTWSTIGFYGPFGLSGGSAIDARPSNTTWFYRARHTGTGYDPGPFTAAILGTSRLIVSREMTLGSKPPVYPIIRDEPLVDGYFALQSDLTDGSNVRKESTIGSVNAHMISRAQHGVFIETFEELPSTWNLRASLGTQVESIVSTGQTGGKAYKAEGYTWRAFPRNIPFDSSKLYRIRVKARRTATSDAAKDFFYCGVEGVLGDGVTLCNTAGTDTFGSQHYIAASGVDTGTWTVDVWQEYTGWFKGWAATGSGSPSTNPAAPAKLHTNVRYFRPLFILNYDGGPTGNKMELDYIVVDVFDEEGVTRTYQMLDTSGTNRFTPGATLVPSNGILEGGTSHKIYRHREEITVNGADSDGDVAVTFGASYQSTPAILFRGGQYVTFSSVIGTGVKQRVRIQPINVTASGFTSRTQICSVGATTPQTDDFASGNVLDAVSETAEVNLDPAGANDDTYTVNYRVSVTVDENASDFSTATLVVAIDSNDGGGWTERATYSYAVSNQSGPPPFEAATSTWDNESKQIVVTGLGTNDDIRIRAKSFAVTPSGTGSFAVRGADAGGSNPDTRNGVTYTTASDTTESAIPSAGDSVTWVAQEVQ